MVMAFKQKQVLFFIIAAIVAATFVAYEPIRHNGFVNYDDTGYITENPNVTGGITQQSIKWALTSLYAANWHPLTWLSHMADCQIFGLNPVGHHFANVSIHIVNALLLFWILNSISSSLWASAFIAAVFALHPLQVESVAWAAERKTVLSGLLWLLTMAVYIRYARKPGFGPYMLLLFVFGICIMTKPSVVTLPLVLLLLDYWPLERIRWGQIGRLILEKIPLLVMSAVSSIMTIIAQKGGEAVVSLDTIPLDTRITNVFSSYIKYIGKLIWPSELAVFYPPSYPAISKTTTAVYILLFILITGISIYIGRRRKYMAVGWLWFVGTLVPMIGLIQAGFQVMANRYMYLSMLGLLIIIAMGCKELIAKHPRLKTVAAVMGVISLSCLLVLTRMQVRHWQNSLTLFEYALKTTKNNVVIETYYGCALLEAGQLDEAEKHLNNAMRIIPTAKALSNLGKVYIKQGKTNEAISCFTSLLRQNETSADGHYYLALSLGMQKKYDEAIKHLARTLEIEPNYPDARNKMALALMATGRLDEAVASFNKLLQKNKNSEEIHYNLAVALGKQNKFDEAIQHLARVLVIDPNYPDARNKMALALVTIGRLDEAVSCYNALLEHQKDSAEIHYRLAVVLGMQNKYDEAIKHLARVLELDPNYPDAHNKIGTLLASTGRLDEAIEHFSEALRTDTDKTKQYSNLARAYQQLGKYEEAIQSWTKAAELKPNDIGIINNLAWLMATVNNTSIENAKKATEFAEHACELTGYKDPSLLDTLAAAYAASGGFEEAATTAQKAIDIAKTKGQDAMAGRIQKRLELYRAGQRYIEK
jgi:tetratricopeptide (TPR) repeat protein